MAHRPKGGKHRHGGAKILNRNAWRGKRFLPPSFWNVIQITSRFQERNLQAKIPLDTIYVGMHHYLLSP